MWFSKNKNILTSYLTLLKVKYTYHSANKLYNEHPYKNSLFAIADMLNDYKIKNKALELKNKADIFALESPFIAYSGNFEVVSKITKEEVTFITENNEIRNLPIEQFMKEWKGIVLIAEPDEYSIEPNYVFNCRKSLIINIEKILLCILLGLFGASFYFSNDIFRNPGLTLSLIVNLIGISIGYLLLQKQLHIHNQYAEKLCNLFSYSSCNNILESKAAKFLGVIGWSEIGFSYFISNVIVILCLPLCMPYLAIINICTLPYTFWSIWFQKVKAKQWCGLCLIIQFTIWSVFLTNIACDFIQFPNLQIIDIIFVICIYFSPFTIISLILPKFVEANKAENLIQEMKSLKMKDEVFFALLDKSKKYEVDKSTSQILFGDKDSELLITIFSNPHCGPCAELHKKINKLLITSKTKPCIQYVFTSFGEEYEKSTLFLIAAYFNNSEKEVRDLYDKWFEYHKYFKEEFFNLHQYNLEDENVMNERNRHKKWSHEHELHLTPTILINGKELPDIYEFEDLKYLIQQVKL